MAAIVVVTAMTMINNDDDKDINRSLKNLRFKYERDGRIKGIKFLEKGFLKRAMAHLSQMEVEKIKQLKQNRASEPRKLSRPLLKNIRGILRKEQQDKTSKSEEDDVNLISFPPTPQDLLIE